MLKNKIYYSLFTLAALLMVSCSAEEGASCKKVKDTTFSPSSTVIDLYYYSPGDANSFLIEYGPTGFTQGTGTTVTTSNDYVGLWNLTPSTTYDAYITSICSAEDRSAAVKISSMTTGPSQCNGSASATIYQSSVNEVELYLDYTDSSPDHYEVQYGLNGFALGSGTTVATTGTSDILTISGVSPDTAYDFYVRAVCYQTDASAWVKYDYTTLTTCPKPQNLNSYYISGSCTSITETRGFQWSYPFASPASYTISVVTTPNVNNPAAGIQFTTSNTAINLNNMSCSYDAFYVKANCSGGSSSQWAGPFYW
ncbi:hypothetical protein [Flavobacterium terrisoli]|uniref:hypothetical protein n=1 Tax=Flavobacterium terrisoli TaxID=3242195 RepID=UPI0025436E43|nr:hypothetical protein [Flavobacterium buctense]